MERIGKGQGKRKRTRSSRGGGAAIKADVASIKTSSAA